jgi:hypothetical protein
LSRMISGRKCRHLNRAGVDIGRRIGRVWLVYLTTHQFLRHNRYRQVSLLPVSLKEDEQAEKQVTSEW